jgi:23S rRNA pseudouridine2605 synthase
MADRLQKILARAGVAARRKAEELILAGRVRVDGQVVTELGTKADLRRQKIELDGKRIVAEPLVYVLLHKPRGTVCTAADPEGRVTVTSLIRGVPGRLVPIGRLDYATSGVLLLSNDGDFSMGLLHPKKKVEKTYVAKVQGEVTEEKVERFKQSIVIDGKPTKPVGVRVLRIENRKTWLELTLEEGKNRQIRRLGEAIGFPILRLARTQFAGITIDGLRPGDFRLLTLTELRDLQKQFGVPKKVHPTSLELPGPSKKKPFHLRPEAARAQRSAKGTALRARQRGRSEANESVMSEGSDQSFSKKPAARTYAEGPRMGSPAAASKPWSNTTKSGTSWGKDNTRKRPSGPLPVTKPSKPSRRSGSR